MKNDFKVGTLAYFRNDKNFKYIILNLSPTFYDEIEVYSFFSKRKYTTKKNFLKSLEILIK